MVWTHFLRALPVLGVMAGSFLFPPEIYGQTPVPGSGERTEAPVVSPQALPQVLEEGRTARKRELSAVRARTTQAKEAYLEAKRDLQSVTVALASLKTTLFIREMSLAQIQEQIQSLSARRSQVLKIQSETARAVESMKQEQAALQESRNVLEKQMESLRSTLDPVGWSREVEESFSAYLRTLKAVQHASNRLIEYAAKRLQTLGREVQMLEEALAELRAREEVRKAEFLKSESVLTAKEQVGGIWQSLETMTHRGWQWLSTLILSGALFGFVQSKFPLLLGLCISALLLRWGAGKIRSVALPWLVSREAATGDVFLRIFLRMVQIAVRYLFLVGLTLLLGLGLWGLQLLPSAPARLALATVGSFVALRLLFRFFHALFAGGREEGILALGPGIGRHYSRGFKLLAAYGLLGSLALFTAQVLDFPEPTRHFLRYLFEAGLLALPLWIFRSPHLQRLLSDLYGEKGEPWSRSARSVWGLVLFLLVAAILSDLLSFHGLSVYLVHSTLISLGGVLLVMLLRVGLDESARYLWHPRDGYLARRYPDGGEWLTRLHEWSGKTISGLTWVTALVGVLVAWGITPGTVVQVLKGLTWGIDVGPVKVTPLNAGLLILVFYGTRWISRLVRSFLQTRVFPRTGWDLGIRYTITTIVHYVTVVLGILVGLNVLGFPLANLALILGALGVGVGLGLQDIVGNFVSGLVLLFERPIKVGDVLVIDGQWGEVKQIRMRSTVFQTADRCTLIIPNSQLTSQRVLNWTHEGRGPNRLQLKVGVSYDSDVKRVTRLLTEICKGNPRVMDEPGPQVFFQAFGESSLDFNVWVFVRSPGDRIPATHEINQAIYDCFREEGIQIPFPQRDLHIHDGNEGIKGKQAHGSSSASDD
ncbi:MAG TPA: mechanosensitive ion channel [Syntrophobacteraceae bacterium]|nr:mechanosensitive ion channel [Syntrophobacteraceae bacterium]